MNSSNKRPKLSRLKRAFFRAPIWLYRIGLGGFMGKRFLLLNHHGRKSGLPRQAVIEITSYELENGRFLVASGFGARSDWYLNLQQTPQTTIQVGRNQYSVHARFLSPTESGEAMANYAQQYPQAAKMLAKSVLDAEIDGSQESYRQLGTNQVPFISLELT